MTKPLPKRKNLPKQHPGHIRSGEQRQRIKEHQWSIARLFRECRWIEREDSIRQVQLGVSTEGSTGDAGSQHGGDAEFPFTRELDEEYHDDGR